MKTEIEIVLIVGASLLLSVFAHAGEQTRFYDNRGNSTGTATTDSQGTTVFRNDRGNTTGTASTDSQGTTVFRDDRGNVTGRASRPSR
jgi:hypothetical protein